METLMSSSSSPASSLLLRSSKNRSFSSAKSTPLLSTSNKPEFVSLFPASHQKRSNYNNVDVSHSISPQFKAIIIGSVSCRSTSCESSFYPQSNAANTEIPSQESFQSKTVKVRFQLMQECSYGKEFLVVGDDPILGAWDPSSAIPLKWSEGNLWKAQLDVPTDKIIQFKFILKDPKTGEIIWDPRPNRVFRTW
ncbi:starch-binding domain-containing protein 1-like [Papaver somniferum]|uniref:starch-binding domain-containing protein 1-like n=1 Tax=Papaver somniferum TaxID=3469 RepID=UPI000E6F9889|nr:starch-binding domain-containing protein 1-like [Papaver somniferum]